MTTTIITLCDTHGISAITKALNCTPRTLEDMRSGISPITAEDLIRLSEVFDLDAQQVQEIAEHNAQQRHGKGRTRLQRAARQNQGKSHRLAKT